MHSFLEQVAESLFQTPSNYWADVCIVLPNRRAGLHLKKTLARLLDKPVFLPAIYSLPVFIASHYPDWVLPDRITLLFELYTSYIKYIPGESFQQFYAWGEMLLNDLEELDKNGVAPEKLFLNLKQAKALEASMGFSPVELESFQQFWQAFSNQPLKKTQKIFLLLWEKLPLIITDFQERLATQRYSYEGRLQAKLATELETTKTIYQLWPYKRYIFAGLHALTQVEATLLNALQKEGNATVLWDADNYYVNGIAEHEAGSFLRQHTPPDGFPSYLGQQQLEIEAIGIPQGMGQVRVAGSLLHQLVQACQGNELERAAIVLPDEDLLLPLLYSLPPTLEAFNVTMGYPLAGSPLHTLLRSLGSLYTRCRITASGNTEYYYEDITRICTNGYLQSHRDIGLTRLSNKIEREGIIYWSVEELQALTSDTILQGVLIATPSSTSTFEALLVLFRSLLAESTTAEHPNALDAEILAHGAVQLQRLYESAQGYLGELSIAALWQLIDEVVRSSRAPFTGEPLAGIQIMGYLETRALTFDTIIMLSCNEGALPPRGNRASFIPYALRKSYGLPTVDDADGINAYHFYRLLQRAKKVILLYDSVTEGEGAAEKSRYLHQLQMELAPAFPDTVVYSEREIPAEIPVNTPYPIVVPKTGEVSKALERFIARNGSSSATDSFSPTDLQTYVTCPLRFYFHKIAKLREAEEIIEELDERLFGLVLHSALEALYKPMKGKMVIEETITELTKQVPALVRNAAKHHVPGLNGELVGKTLLLIQVMEKLIRKLLDIDLAYVPFTITHIEEKLSISVLLQNGTHVTLAGRVDRIDEKHGQVRILDYKTGGINTNKAKTVSDVFTDSKYKYALQALLYSLLLNTDRQIQVGIIPMRTLYTDGILDPLESIDKNQFKESSLTHLKVLITEILDVTKPFIQKKDEKTCNTCPYYRMCYLG